MSSVEHSLDPIAETDDNPGLMKEDVEENNKINNDSQTVFRRLIHVAWLSIILGILLEIILVVVAGVSQSLGNSKPVIVDLVQKVSWSFFVCMGLAVGTAVTKTRVATMGLMGLLAAPMAFYIARALHKALAQALSLTNSAALSGPSPLLLATCKALEYCFLGMALGWLATNHKNKTWHYLVVGIFTGIVFGGSIVTIMANTMTQPLIGVALYTRLANEILFPVGCALVIFSADTLARQK